jgi:uncharacterized protein YqgV (UPF0045/DUF77 family)
VTRERLITLIARALSIDDFDAPLASVDFTVLEPEFQTLLDAVNQCERDACKAKYQEVCAALHQCECGKPQKFLGEQRCRKQ